MTSAGKRGAGSEGSRPVTTSFNVGGRTPPREGRALSPAGRRVEKRSICLGGLGLSSPSWPGAPTTQERMAVTGRGDGPPTA